MKPGIGLAVSTIFLTGAWCALWGGVSVANLLGGLAVGLIASITVGPKSRTLSVSFPALAQLLMLIAKDLVASTLSVAREVLTPTDYTDELFLDIQLRPGAEHHLLLLTIAVTLTPGTAVVDVDRANAILRLHLLHADRREPTIEHVHQLSELAIRALPQEVVAT